MINIKGGPLWQWSIGRKVIITPKEGYTVNKVEFSNGIIDHAIKGKLETETDGTIVAEIPPQLLQYASGLTVYAVSANEALVQTTEAVTFAVNGRTRPEDYVYTEEEIRTFEEHAKHLTVLDKTAEEVEDARKDHNGKVHKNLGEALRTQFKNLFQSKVSLPTNASGTVLNGTYGQKALSDGKGGIYFVNDTNIPEVDKTLKLSGVPADSKAVGDAIERVALNSGASLEVTGKFKPVTFADIDPSLVDTKLVVTSNGIGETLGSMSYQSASGHCVYATEVKKGDMFVASNAWLPSSNGISCMYVIAKGPNDTTPILKQAFDPFYYLREEKYGYDGKFICEADGVLYVCFDYANCNAGEYFYIKRQSTYEPFVLKADKAEEYDVDPTMGDATLEAILQGRQIMVRVPNADGNNYTAIYSPVYMYQLPNYMNPYLYLFYLKDEKQYLNLSALGMGQIELPIYGQLKMKLSRDYNQTPLLYCPRLVDKTPRTFSVTVNHSSSLKHTNTATTITEGETYETTFAPSSTGVNLYYVICNIYIDDILVREEKYVTKVKVENVTGNLRIEVTDYEFAF